MKKRFNFFVFIFFLAFVFTAFKDLFNSYFEADEWFHFTHYLPLTHEPYGFLTTFISTFIDTQTLSRGQHVVPIGEEIFFLNTLFFGINYTPYAFLTILLHSINSFLVFLMIKELLVKGKARIRNTIFALLGGVFFALGQIHFHAVAWAAFYGQNNLSVTFFLLCILFFKKALNTKRKLFLFLSLMFLLLDLLTKETATALFFILPAMALLDRKVFSLRYLSKIYLVAFIIFISFRFIIPNVYLGLGKLTDKWVDSYISSAKTSVGNKESGTIVSTDLSIHENIYRELAFRTITFPVKMTSEFFFPRETVLSFMRILTPIIYPLPSNVSGDEETIRSQNYQFFMNGPGNDLIIYILSLFILIIVINRIKQFRSDKKVDEYKAVITGLSIVVLGALPLVLIVLSFPRWGYDTYFDSRHYYLPSVGAAILFPFIVFGIGDAISKIIPKFLRSRNLPIILAFLVFAIWFANNLYMLNRNFDVVVDMVGSPRRQIIDQLKNYVPVLHQKAVFYVETDGLGAYGPQLPFQTSIPQVLTVVYYDKNPLPDSFFNKALFEGKSQGYAYLDRRGFGYYTSKKELSEALLANSFKTSDIYAFYYDSQKVKVLDTTSQVRLEMEDYLEQTKANSNWNKFSSSSNNLSFYYPPEAFVEETEDGEFSLNNPNFSANIKVFNVSSGFDINEYSQIKSQEILGVVSSKKVSYDKFHYNDALVIMKPEAMEYLIKFDDKLIFLTTPNLNESAVEKILGSVDVFK